MSAPPTPLTVTPAPASAAARGPAAPDGRALIRCLRCGNTLAEWRVVDGALCVVVRLRAQRPRALRLAGAPPDGRRTVVAGPDSAIVCERCGQTWRTPDVVAP